MKMVRRKDTNPSLVQYSPIRSMLDDFFSTSFDDVFNRAFSTKNLSVDVWEEDDDFVVKMAMPGVDKDNIEISTTADTVTIKGQVKKVDKKDEKKKYYYRSLEESFEQTFNLPTKVDTEKAEAEYKDGILTLTLPKAEDIKPKKIEVK